MLNESRAVRWTWLAVLALSIVQAGAYIGNETSAHYFWDLTSYVEALDSEFPYRAQRTYPFLYPPFAADLFTLARSHLFELMSIAYVAAIVLFLTAYARLKMPRRFEWLLAMTAMGGLGVVSLQSGNLAIPMNLTLLAVTMRAAMGDAAAARAMPFVIGFGALLKPQFIVYLGLLPFLERSRLMAFVKMAVVAACVAAVYGGYVAFRFDDWNEYVRAITQRAVVEKDYAWGPAGFIKHWSESTAAATAAFAIALIAVAALAYAAWRHSALVPPVAVACLVFVVLTFANPRLPVYDIYVAGIALVVCCGFANRKVLPVTLLIALSVNVIPWTIANFTRTPSAWPWWMQTLQFAHIIGFGGLLVALAFTGMHQSPPEP